MGRAAVSAVSLLLATATSQAAGDGSCDLGVVGAGPGGAYVAWRYALARPKETVCLFELGRRVGGRVHSLRAQGPDSDLVVEAGAYRFAPNETCVAFLNQTYCVHTPLTAHLILGALKLQAKRYNPDASSWDHELYKIVDTAGHDAGYLTFIEAMAREGVALPNLRLRYGHELTTIGAAAGANRAVAGANGASASANLSLAFANGASFSASRLVLNLPQRPLLRVLAQSPTLVPPSAPWPSALTVPNAYPIIKLYIHYDDAWWINDLSLRHGSFNNSDAWKTDSMGPRANDDCLAAKQTPYPLQGSYHDADVRCDRSGPRPCRGFIQAAYMGDVQAVHLYETFHLSGNDSVVELTPERADHRYMLQGMHEALVATHKEQLVAAGAMERVAKMAPSGGVLSVWSQRAVGLEAGCHLPRVGPPVPVKSVPMRSLVPIEGEDRVLVANEAFGTKECWAEGSLAMAENVAHKLGLARPSWLPQDVYDQLIFREVARAEAAEAAEAAEPQADARGVRHATDLMMATMAAASGY